MKYTTSNNETIEMVKDFYPFNVKPSKNMKVEIVINEGNKCVLKLEHQLDPMIPPHLVKMLQQPPWHNGYVVFHKSELPTEFALDYDREGLNFLSIHKGISYHEIVCSDSEAEKELVKEYKNKFAEREKRWKDKFDPKKHGDQYMSEREDIENWFRDAKIKLGYEWIVYGFDCNHLDDDKDPLLQDPNHIFQLTVQMEQQIRALASIWTEFKAQPSSDLKMLLLQNVINQAEIKTELGLGGIIRLMNGSDEL